MPSMAATSPGVSLPRCRRRAARSAGKTSRSTGASGWSRSASPIVRGRPVRSRRPPRASRPWPSLPSPIASTWRSSRRPTTSTCSWRQPSWLSRIATAISPTPTGWRRARRSCWPRITSTRWPGASTCVGRVDRPPGWPRAATPSPSSRPMPWLPASAPCTRSSPPCISRAAARASSTGRWVAKASRRLRQPSSRAVSIAAWARRRAWRRRAGSIVGPGGRPPVPSVSRGAMALTWRPSSPHAATTSRWDASGTISSATRSASGSIPMADSSGARIPAPTAARSASEGGVDMNTRRDTLRTALCDLLGIEYPILQSGMGGVAGPELVAEVSRAGGLGILAGLRLTGDQLRQGIRRVRELTDKPFGVNLWLHTEIRPPVDPATLPDETLRRVQGALDQFRHRLGIPPVQGRPPAVPNVINEAFEVILEERVPVWSIGLGNPGRDMVARCHERGIKIVAMVATVDDARAVAASGVDVVVAQGSEAGGHRSTWIKPASPEMAQIGAMALVPQIVDAVDMPVVASGGLADGRGLVAALALGAVGVLLGTRFVATRESAAAEFWKKALLERGSEATTVTDAFTGLYARALRSAFTEDYAASGAPVLPALLQSGAAQDIFAASTKQQNPEYVPMWSGQSVGLIHDLPGAAEVVETMVREARLALRALNERVRLG